MRSLSKDHFFLPHRSQKKLGTYRPHLKDQILLMKWHHTAENRKKKKSRQNNKTLPLLAARFKGAPEAAGRACVCSFSWNHWWDKVTYPPFMIVSEQSRDRSRRVRMPLPTGHFALDHCQVQTLPTRQSTQQIPALAERQALKGKEGSLIVSPPNSPIRHPPSLHSQGREKDLLAWGVKVPSSCGYLGRQWGRRIRVLL